MPDIARLDDAGVLIAVDTVSPADHKTDAQARTVALPAGHDMHTRLNDYRFDFLAGAFFPVGAEPLDKAERNAPGLVEFVEQMEREHGVVLPPKTKRAVRAFPLDRRWAAAMTQAADLGGVANQAGTLYRTRINAGFQVVTTFHYGTAEPPVMYPNMVWFDQGTGTVKLRDPTNTYLGGDRHHRPAVPLDGVRLPADGVHHRRLHCHIYKERSR